MSDQYSEVLKELMADEAGANALTWNSNLASYAANYAANCKFAHSGGPYGENL